MTKARNVSLDSVRSVRSDEKVRDAKKNLLKTKMKKTPAKQKLPRSSTVKNSPVAKSMVNMLNSMNLPCVKSMAAKLDQDQKMPPNPHLQLARVCGNLATLNKVTKPSYICSRVGVQTDVVQLCTRQASQWGMSRVPRQGSKGPIDQSEGARQQSADGQRLEYL